MSFKSGNVITMCNNHDVLVSIGMFLAGGDI